jgi:hypothetical protein
MFSSFKKRQPTLMDQTIKAIYGEKPLRKSVALAGHDHFVTPQALRGL